MNTHAAATRLATWVVAATCAGWIAAPSHGAEFPRLAGVNYGSQKYNDSTYQQQLARLDLVILGTWKGWHPEYGGLRQVVLNIKGYSTRNTLVGQYTIMNEARYNLSDPSISDLGAKLDEMDWWARNARGQKVQWTSAYNAWDINFTAWTAPDQNGQRWPQWLPERDYSVFFGPAPELDIWFVDNVWTQPRVTADWNLDGKNDSSSDPVIGAAYRAGHRAEWDRIRQIAPGKLLIGNADHDLSSPEYVGQLEGNLFEGAMGKSWSLETWAGWAPMMARYRAMMANTRPPHLVILNVQGSPTNYQFFRYAYASCLLDDGFFSFTDTAVGYNSVPWFDEYDHRLGAPIAAPPAAAWQKGVWRRDFQAGIALVNPSTATVTVALEPGFRRIAGTQAPTVNDGSATTSVTLAPKDGIVLLRQ